MESTNIDGKPNLFQKIRLKIENFYAFLEEKYGKYMQKNIPKKIRRIFAVWWTIIAFVLSMQIPSKFEMFPSDDADFFMVSVKNSAWTITEETEKSSLKVEEIIRKIPEVKFVEISTKKNKSNLRIELFEKDFRKEKWLKTSVEIIKNLQKQFKQFKNFQVNVEEVKKWPPGSSPIAFKIVANDAKKIPEAQKVAEDLKEILRKIEWTDWIKDNVDNTPWEIKYTINRAKALILWINPDAVWAIVRSAVEGSEAGNITKNWREVKITVKYEDWAIKNFDDIWEIQIPNNQWKTISLSQITEKELTSWLTNIRRIDWKIAITVSSLLSEDWNALEISWIVKERLEKYKTLNWEKIIYTKEEKKEKTFIELMESISSFIKSFFNEENEVWKFLKYELPEWITIEDAWENQENKDLFIGLLIGLISAIFMIFTILVIQFNSFKQPLIILFTIIMAQHWVSIWLYLTDTYRSLAFIIWIISLAWIVVNDAIILVDRINQLRKEYSEKPLNEIIAMAWESRFQPIILTTLTTMAWILPLVFVDQFWKWLAVTIIFWLSVASTLTLFVTPALYYWMEKSKNK